MIKNNILNPILKLTLSTLIFTTITTSSIFAHTEEADLLEMDRQIEITQPQVSTSTRSLRNIALDDYIIDQEVFEEVITLQCYDDKTYLQNVGTTRGDHQIRVVIPYTLKAGETITLWQVEGLGQVNPVAELKPGLASNDVNQNILSNGDVVSLTALDESVVYIRLPRQKFKDITIKYSITKATTLPRFIHNETDEDTFFALWDLLGTKNAVLETDITVLQIPDKNKEYLRNLNKYNNFDNINHLLRYYQEMIDFFDYSYGLDNSTEYNYNPGQRYLAVPELRNSGGVVGTYSTNIVKVFGETRGMLKMLDDSWLAKHEFAHGYQGSMMDFDVSVREVWNNIPSHYYSMVTNSNYNEYETKYNNVDKPSNQKKVYDNSVKIRNNNSSASYDLNFFREIFDQYGLETFIQFNQEYRRLGITGDHNTISNSNQFAKLFSKYADIDLVPYFLSFNADIDTATIEETKNLNKAYYLTELVDNVDIKNYVVENYDLVTEYSLVDTTIFSSDSNLNHLRSDVVIDISIDNLDQLQGKQILLSNGRFQYKSQILGQTVIFENIPIGVYNISYPLTNDGNHTFNGDRYVVLKENETSNANVEYEKNQFNHLNMMYRFIIRTNSNYTSLSANINEYAPNKYNITVETLDGRNNSHLGNNDLYGYFKVIDDNGKVLYNNEFFNSTPTVVTSQIINLEKGYEIHLGRMAYKEKKDVINIINNANYKNISEELTIFKVTENGLENDNWNNDFSNILASYKTSADKLGYFTNNFQYDYTKERVIFKNAISFLNSDLKNMYSINNAHILRTNNPIIDVMDNITLTTNDTYDLTDYAKAIDVEDGEISRNIIVKNTNIDNTKAGVYEVTFYVEDSDYNYDQKTVFVTISDNDDILDNNNGDDNEDIVDIVEDPIIIDDVEDSENIDNTTIPPLVEKPTEIPTELPSEIIISNNGNPVVILDTDNRNNDEEIILIPEPVTEAVILMPEEGNKDIDLPVVYTFIDEYNNKITLRKRTPFTTNEIKIGTSFSQLENKEQIVPYTMINGKKVYYMLSSYTKDSLLYIENKVGLETNFEYNEKHFTDTNNSWARSNINFVASRNILNGVSSNEFAPNATVTRGMIVTVLGRLSGDNFSGYGNIFKDVEDNTWYTDYVNWAKAKNIVSGTSSTTFQPKANLTREQLAIIIHNYLTEVVGYEFTNTQQKFKDDDNISIWAKDSVYLLKSIGLLQGDLENNFNPKANLTRAELSAILMRLVEYCVNAENNF